MGFIDFRTIVGKKGSKNEEQSVGCAAAAGNISSLNQPSSQPASHHHQPYPTPSETQNYW